MSPIFNVIVLGIVCLLAAMLLRWRYWTWRAASLIPPDNPFDHYGYEQQDRADRLQRAYALASSAVSAAAAVIAVIAASAAVAVATLQAAA